MLKAFLWGLIWLFLSFRPVLGQVEFLTDYRVGYEVLPDGLTKAELQISLINQLSNVYAKEFTLSIGSTQLSQIRVTDSGGPLKPEIVSGTKTVNINIPFSQKVVGKDKAQNFSLDFLSADFSHRLGNIWEISIPRLTKTENLRNYDLTLTVPKVFGSPSRMTPMPSGQTDKGSTITYRFNTEDLWEQGISATFGSVQYFNFNLAYHLENPNLFPLKTELALPPDTAWQTVLYAQIEPEPESLKIDPDGNWLAVYSLSARQNLTVIASGSAEIFLEPKSAFKQPLNSAINYLSRQQYWEIDNPKLIKLGQELKTPQKIYQYLVDNLVYDYGRIDDANHRFGAANALDNPSSAICMEFTDLFVALARAAGIPSRSVNGFAYTTNASLRPLSLKKDVLHAWPEYYDPQRELWVPVDPTWGNTTGGVDFFRYPDLNHFTFVMQGADSQYPVPAGAYKSSQTDTKDVLVEFGPAMTKNPGMVISFDLPKTALAGVATSGRLIVKNTGNIALYQPTVSLQTSGVSLNQNSWEIPLLLPKSTQVLEFTLNPTAWNTNQPVNFKAVSSLTSAEHLLTIQPFYRSLDYRYLAALVAAGTLLIIGLKIIYNKLRS